MAVIYDEAALHDGSIRGGVCSFGVFDGVHRGHRFIIERALDEARRTGSPCLVLTFDRDPDELFARDRLKKIMSNEHRLRTLADLPVDGVVAIPFSLEFASQLPRAFLDSTFGDCPPRSLHVGEDFRFGRKAAGDIKVLADWGSENGVDVRGHELHTHENQPITSTRIRALLAAGKVEAANELLCAPYCVEALVQRGRGEGRDFGFRTANLCVDDLHRCLGDGVYAAYAHVEGKRYKAAVSNGVSPTFSDESQANVEAHILDFEGDLYGKEIALEFISWLRPMMTFPSVDELIRTVMGNIEWVRANL